MTDSTSTDATGETGRSLADKTAIGLSLLCAFHCLVLPILIVLAPAIGSLAIADESFHLWMVAVVIPVSAYALFLGCRQHRRFTVLALGVSGIVILTTAALFAHDLFGENAERAGTLVGASLIAWSHWLNFRYCRGAVPANNPS